MVGGTGEQRKYTVKPQPNVGAEKSKYYRQVSVQLSDSIKGLLHLKLINGIASSGTLASFHLHPAMSSAALSMNGMRVIPFGAPVSGLRS